MRDKKISQEIRKAHSRVSGTYAGGILGELKPNSYPYWNRRQLLTYIKYALERYCAKDGILLDAGCGNGQFTEIFIKQYGIKEVVGVDFSEEMLDVAKERAEVKGYSQHFKAVKANLEDLRTFNDNTFDIVFHFGVIEHLDNPEKVIKELVRVCKVNGVILINVPIKWSLAHMTMILFGQNPRDWGTKKKSFKIWETGRYYKFYSPKTVKRMVDNTERCKILERLPRAYIWVVGIAAIPFNLIAKIGGLRALDCLNGLFGYLYRIPYSEFWVIKKYKSEGGHK